MRSALVPICVALALWPTATSPLTFDLPEGAQLAAETEAPIDRAEIPVGAYAGGQVPSVAAEGALTRRAWQFPRRGFNTLQMLEPLRRHVIDEGFEILFECEAETCGGFDFRFATDTLPEPAMHVDLGDYRFLSARRDGEDAPDYVELMVSRSASRGFVQVTHVGAAAAADKATLSSAGAPEAETAMPATTGPTGADTLARTLVQDGHAVLGDLEFQTGSARLGAGPFDSLRALAAYLLENPARSVILVGHTDAEGALDGNIALSKQRAEAVRTYLTETLGVPPSQVTAEGVGFLAPLASNRTEAGRMQNRRVEVVAGAVE